MQQFFHNIANDNPQWIAFLFLLLATCVFIIFSKWMLSRLHKRFKKQNQIWKDSLVQSLYLPLKYLILFSVIFFTINYLLEHFLPQLIFYDKRMIFVIAMIAMTTWFFLRWKNAWIQLSVAMRKREKIPLEMGKIDVFNKLSTLLILFIALFLLLEATHQNLTTLIAFGGIGGLALAISSQEIIGNFFGGVMIYLTRPFSVGDWVKIPEKGIEGHVEEIGWYLTRVRTFEKRPLYIPNALFVKAIIETPSLMSHRQFKEIIGLRYSDLKTIGPVMNEIKNLLKQSPFIDQHQSQQVFLDKFGAYSVDIIISAYTKTTDSLGFMEIKQQLLLKIADILEMYHAEMASPMLLVELPNEFKEVFKKMHNLPQSK